MRRALLTNRPFGGPPFTVGNPAVTGSDFSQGYLAIATENPAPRAGVITTMDVYTGAGGGGSAIYVLTGALSGTTFTVNTVAALTAAAGLTSHSVSLPISSGEVVAFWAASGQRVFKYSGAGTLYYKAMGTAPTNGQVITGTTSFAGMLSLQGTGS